MADPRNPYSGIGMMSSGGGTPGSGPIGYTPEYGGIPNLPLYTTDTSSMVGTDVQAQMLANLPGYQQMLLGDTRNIQSNLAGQVSPDVLKLMQQQAAERGVQTGMPGAPAGDAAYLRALGLTSLQIQQLGHTQLNEAMARTPIQQTQNTTTTHDLGAERAVYAAAPNPKAAAEQALANALAGMGAGAGAGAGGSNRPGGYTLNPAAPRSSLQAAGYNADSWPGQAAQLSEQAYWDSRNSGRSSESAPLVDDFNWTMPYEDTYYEDNFDWTMPYE